MMSTASNDLLHLNTGLDTLTTSVVSIMDAAFRLERRLKEPVLTWTLNTSALCSSCEDCRYQTTCWNYGDPALRQSFTATGTS